MEAVGLLIPVTLACLLLLVFALRLAAAGQDLTATAAAAARAASRQPTAAAGLTAAQAETARLTSQGDRSAPAGKDARVVDVTDQNTAVTGDGRCAQVGTALDAGAFTPGGSAVVTVTCTLSTRGLTGISLPGHLTRTVTSRAPIDRYVEANGR